MKTYNKLIRDKIPTILDSKGVEYQIRVAEEKEYWRKLKQKLSEEVVEFLEDESIEELADILEVIESIKKFKKWSTHVEEVRLDKKVKRGGFEDRIILIKS